MSTLQSIGSGARKAIRFLGFGAAIKAVRTARASAIPEIAKAGAAQIREDLTTTQRAPARVESFKDACARLHVGQQDLLEVESRLAKSALFWRLASAATLAIGVLSLALTSDSASWALLYFFEGLAVSLLFAARAFRDSFRLWQIRRRELAPVRTFVRDGGLYFAMLGG